MSFLKKIFSIFDQVFIFAFFLVVSFFSVSGITSAASCVDFMSQMCLVSCSGHYPVQVSVGSRTYGTCSSTNVCCTLAAGNSCVNDKKGACSETSDCGTGKQTIPAIGCLPPNNFCCVSVPVGQRPFCKFVNPPSPPNCCGGMTGAPPCSSSSSSSSACTGTGETCRSTCRAGETSTAVCTSSGLKCCVAAGTAGTSTLISFSNPLAFGTVEGVLGSLLGELRGIIVVLSLVFIVIGAVFYIFSAGDDGRMKTAKGAITASMIGLAIGIAAPSFLKQIGDILGWGAVNNSLPANTKTLTEIALSTLQFLLSIVGILGIIMLVIGGLAYITAGGDEDRSKTGKKIVTYAIIGIAVALASLIIVTQIAKLFV